MNEHQDINMKNGAEVMPHSSPQHENTWVQAAQKPARKRIVAADHRDKVMALAMILIAFLVSEVFGVLADPGIFGVGVTILTVLYAAGLIWYVRSGGRPLSRESCFWLAVMVLSAVPYTFVFNQSLVWFHPVFLRLTTLYATMISLRALVMGETSEFVLFDGINMTLIVPFHNFDLQWRIAGQEIRKMKFVNTALKAVLGLLAAVPLLFLVTSLLSAADDGFGELLVMITQEIGSDFFRYIWSFMFSLPIGCYLFGLLYGAAHRQGTDTFKADRVRSVCAACGVIPAASVYAVLLAICSIYVLFIGLQGGYYLSAVKGILPDGFTYSEYARQGFFELITVSLINLGIIGAARLFCRGKGRILKGFYLLISVLTLFLIATALTKMFLYIGVYGLTPLRVIPSVFMLFMIFVFALIILSQFRPVPVIRLSIGAFAIGYTMLSLVNMDGGIARYNLSRYQTGTLSELPGEALRRGSFASIPAIYDLWKATDDPQLKDDLLYLAREIEDDGRAVQESADHLKYGNIAKSKALEYIGIMSK